MDNRYIILGLAAVAYFFLSKKQTAAVTDTGYSPGYDIPVTNAPAPLVYSSENPSPVQSQNVHNVYYQSLASIINDAKYLAAFDKMTDAELKYSWWYANDYLAMSKPLLSYTKQNADGSFDNSNPGNTELYNAIRSIHSKYNIF